MLEDEPPAELSKECIKNRTGADGRRAGSGENEELEETDQDQDSTLNTNNDSQEEVPTISNQINQINSLQTSCLNHQIGKHPAAQQISMQKQQHPLPPMQQNETTRSIMKNSSLKSQLPSYYETNSNLWQQSNEHSPKSTSTSATSSSQASSCQQTTTGVVAPTTTTSSTLPTPPPSIVMSPDVLQQTQILQQQPQSQTQQKPKVRFNLDINYEKEREWNRVNKIIVDASKSEIEWTQEVEV